MKIRKTNKLSAIIAKKGSGKSLFSTALALAQDKQTFYITPLKNSFYLLPTDTINYKGFQPNLNNQINYIEVLERENIDKELNRIIRISENSAEGKLLIIDELDFYASAHLSYKSKIFSIINYGRHAQLDIIFIARRLQDIPSTTLTNCDYVYLGQNNNIENDRKYYKQFFNDRVIEFSKLLNKGEFLEYRTDTATLTLKFISEKVANSLIRNCKNE